MPTPIFNNSAGYSPAACCGIVYLINVMTEKAPTLLTVFADGSKLATRIVACVSASARRQGLLNRKSLTQEEGVLLVLPVQRSERSGLATSIHMMGIKFPVAVAWLRADGEVVHAVLAQPWRLYYGSPKPASYVLEVHPVHLARLRPGVLIHWVTMENICAT